MWDEDIFFKYAYQWFKADMEKLIRNARFTEWYYEHGQGD